MATGVMVNMFGMIILALIGFVVSGWITVMMSSYTLDPNHLLLTYSFSFLGYQSVLGISIWRSEKKPKEKKVKP